MQRSLFGQDDRQRVKFRPVGATHAPDAGIGAGADEVREHGVAQQLENLFVAKEVRHTQEQASQRMGGEIGISRHRRASLRQ